MILNKVSNTNEYTDLLVDKNSLFDVLDCTFKYLDKIDFRSKNNIELEDNVNLHDDLFIKIENSENKNIKIWIMLAGNYNNLHINEEYVPIIEDHNNIKNDPLKLLDENLNLIFNSKIEETITYYGDKGYKFHYKLFDSNSKEVDKFTFRRNFPSLFKKKKIITTIYEPWIKE